jgi:hypothetical protein
MEHTYQRHIKRKGKSVLGYLHVRLPCFWNQWSINILPSMEPKCVPPAPEAIQFPKIWTLFGKHGVRQVQKSVNLKLWIPIVPVPRVVQFCEFCWPLVWCDAKFGSGIQRSRGFQGHKNMRLVTKHMNIFTLPHGKKTSTWKDSHQPATNEKANEWKRWLLVTGSAVAVRRTRKNKTGNVRIT